MTIQRRVFQGDREFSMEQPEPRIRSSGADRSNQVHLTNNEPKLGAGLRALPFSTVPL
jgi:hypothetical protein